MTSITLTLHVGHELRSMIIKRKSEEDASIFQAFFYYRTAHAMRAGFLLLLTA